MKNENVHMQALHRKLDVLVQVVRYNCSETDYSFCKDSIPQQDSALYPGAGFTLRPLQPLPHYCFRSAANAETSTFAYPFYLTLPMMGTGATVFSFNVGKLESLGYNLALVLRRSVCPF